MSKKTGQPARHTSAVTNKAVLISATAIAAASLVAVAYTLAAPPKESGTATSFVTASSPSGLVRLSAAGLDSLLNTRFSPVHTAVTDQGTSAAQQVSVMLGNGSGQLSNDGSVLTLNVPAIGDIDGSVASALGPINAQMGDLSGSNGEVANSVNSDVVGISPLLNLTGPHSTVSANVPIDLDAAIAPQLAGTTQEGAVSIDPNAGTVAIDLSNLLADNGDGSQTLSPAATAEIEADINAASANLGDNLVNAATSSVENTPVNVNANVSLVSTPTSSSSGSCTNSTSTSGETSAAGGGLLSGLLGNTLNGILGSSLGSTVDGTVSGLLCSLPTNLLGGLLTSLGLDQTGNVGQIIEGTAPPATGSITVLGAPKPFNGIAFTGNVANTLVKNFGGSTATGGSAGSGTSGSGSSSGNSGLGLTIGANLGDNGLGGLGLGGLGLGGLGLGGSGTGGLDLGGLNLGGLLGSNGTTGVTPGILQSLLANGGSNNLPLGVSATVGDGSTAGSNGTSTPSGSGLLNIKAGTNGTNGLSGLNGSVTVGSPAPATGSTGSSGGSTGSSCTGPLGLVHTSSSSGQCLVNLGN
ncbi:MAG TPA: hypothetical protein VHZ98_00605 [Galbitalea sp.]|jgi:hypothetical protein|nr:hypothetical protein [Galbitalea sp.]